MRCPACLSPAGIMRRYVLDSTDGPIEHAVVMCASGHIWNGPVATFAEEPA